MFGYALAQGLANGLIHGKKYVKVMERAHLGLWEHSLRDVPETEKIL